MFEEAFDCIKKGFSAAVALWPLFIVRFIEMIIIMMVLGVIVFAGIIALGLTIDFHAFGDLVDDPEAVAEWLLANWSMFFSVLVIGFLAAGVAVLVHSYFEAGVTALYLRYIKNREMFGWREGWARFSLQDFTSYAMSRGWTVFLVYNIVWGVAGAIILIPLLLILAVLLVFKDAPVAIVFTCLGLVLVVMLTIVVSIVAATWTQIAITLASGERMGAVAASGRAGDLIRARVGVTVVVVAIVYAVLILVSSAFSTMGFGLGAFSGSDELEMMMLGMHAVLSLINTVVSTLLGLWVAAVWASFTAGPTFLTPAPPMTPTGGNLGPGQPVVG